MDYKQFRKHLCQLTGHSPADVDALTDGLALIIRESCAELDNVRHICAGKAQRRSCKRPLHRPQTPRSARNNT